MKSTLFILALFGLFLLNSCYYDKEVELYPWLNFCDSTLTDYELDIQPILETNCYTCHRNGRTLGELNIENFSELMTIVNNGSLLCSIKHEQDCDAMPKNRSKLNDCDILKINKWIENGALEN